MDPFFARLRHKLSNRQVNSTTGLLFSRKAIFVMLFMQVVYYSGGSALQSTPMLIRHVHPHFRSRDYRVLLQS